MNLFKRFKKSSNSVDDNILFSFNFFVDSKTNNIILDFKSKPGQERLVAEFCFKIRNDEDLWLSFFKELSKVMDENAFLIFKEHLVKLYHSYMNTMVPKTIDDSDDPVISPLIGKDKS